MTGLLVISGVVLLFAGGAMLIARGLWPRRVGDEPRCRRCGYNLTGLTSGRCPECGTELGERAIVRGTRRRRPVLAIGGALLILLALTPLLAAVPNIDWYRYKPTSWVIQDLDTANRNTFNRAWTELMRRDTAGTVSSSNRRRLIASCLTEQSKPKGTPVRSRMIDYLGACLIRGSLAPHEQDRFHDQISILRLLGRSSVRRGEPVIYRLEHTSRGPSANQFWIETRCTGAWIDGEQQPGGEIGMGRTAGVGAGGSVGTSVRFDVPGQHTLRVAAVVRTYVGPWGDEDASTLYDERTHMVEADFEIVEATQADLIKTIDDPSQVHVLRQCITIERLECDGKWLECEIKVELPPVPVAFEVFAQCGQRKYRLGTLSRPAGASAMSHHLSNSLEGPCPEEPCTIILQGSADVAEHSVELFSFWAGELAFEGVSATTDAAAADAAR